MQATSLAILFVDCSLKERNPNLSPAITQLPPVFLDELVYAKSNQGGYDVGKGS